ncbi:hypothetical protein AWC38_SpisGene13322 [Stylophora pistillata]|uniref:Uncharacterized protein n=1 Tax=Stylophora pistillata TaxID=50429 RepID=A0A2B4RYA9_STYPI|nr:hypothetical protein AWC38_SpisGene13322 [Stylophora pistillata]
MFQIVVEYAPPFFVTIKRKRNLNGEFIKIFEEVFSQKVLPDDGLPRAVCDTCRYRIETSWEQPKERIESRQSPNFVLKRDKRGSRRAELGRYFGSMDGQTLFCSASCCLDMLDIPDILDIHDVIHTGLNILMPVRRVRVNSSDVPWVTPHLKSLILKRQRAFLEHGVESSSYKLYRNAVDRERKSCKASFYKVKVEHMKEENPKLWWKEVKLLSGSQSNSGNVINHIHIKELEDCNNHELANTINRAFLEPLEEYRLEQPLSKFPVPADSPRLHEVSTLRIMKLLATLNPSKACGPDEIPNWLLKEYAELLAYPVSNIINSSFNEQRLPKIWKFADVSPLPEVKPVEDLKKHLRPISLTPCLSKVAEECVVVEGCVVAEECVREIFRT